MLRKNILIVSVVAVILATFHDSIYAQESHSDRDTS